MTNIQRGLTYIVGQNTNLATQDADGWKIAEASFNYAISIAIDSVIAASVDLQRDPLAIGKLIDELKQMKV